MHCTAPPAPRIIWRFPAIPFFLIKATISYSPTKTQTPTRTRTKRSEERNRIELIPDKASRRRRRQFSTIPSKVPPVGKAAWPRITRKSACLSILGDSLVSSIASTVHPGNRRGEGAGSFCLRLSTSITPPRSTSNQPARLPAYPPHYSPLPTTSAKKPVDNRHSSPCKDLSVPSLPTKVPYLLTYLPTNLAGMGRWWMPCRVLLLQPLHLYMPAVVRLPANPLLAGAYPFLLFSFSFFFLPRFVLADGLASLDNAVYARAIAATAASRAAIVTYTYI